MKKILAIGLAAALSLTVLAGCGETNNNQNNTAPTISGVPESATVMAGEEWDALQGVTASDKEDGDLTSKIEVSARGLTFTGGKTTPTEARESSGYQVRYTVKDSGGLEAEEQFCVLYVKQAAAELVNVFEADFSAAPTVPQDKANDAMHYWELVQNGGTATASLEKGALVVNVTNGGAQDDAVYLKRHFPDLSAAKYRVITWVESSAATKLKATASVEGKDTTFSGEEVDVKAGYQKLEWTIDATEGDLWFNLLLGGGEGRATAYTLSILKIDIFMIIGTGADEVLVNKTFTDSADGITDGGSAAISFNEATHETHIAVKYGEENADWNSKAVISLGDNAVEKGTQYKLSFKVKATKALNINVCVEQKEDADAWQNRAFFETVTAPANEEKEITVTLDWHDGNWKGLESGNAVCRLYLGVRGEEGATDNDVVIKDFKFLKPGQTERKAHDNFLLFGGSSVNAAEKKYPFELFNGSDSETLGDGVGTAYIENGKLIYKIYEGATLQGNHKLTIGFGTNSIDLPANAYYVVKLKIKASVALDFNLTLHDMDCGDNWDSGLLLRRADFNNPADPVHIDTTEQTLEFTSKMALKDSKCELILEFGSAALSELGGATIEISELEIGYRAVQA